MIQEIRYRTGLNEHGGGQPEVKDMYRERGMNPENRAALYPGDPSELTMGAVDPAGPFGGCTNDAQLSFYLGKLSLSWALRGLVAGVAIGAAGAVVGVYFLNKRGGR